MNRFDSGYVLASGESPFSSTFDIWEPTKVKVNVKLKGKTLFNTCYQSVGIRLYNNLQKYLLKDFSLTHVSANTETPIYWCEDGESFILPLGTYIAQAFGCIKYDTKNWSLCSDNISYEIVVV